MMKRASIRFLAFAGLVAALLVPLAARSAEMYYNQLAAGTDIVPVGTHGAITVSTKGYSAMKFPSAIGGIPTSGIGKTDGSYAKIIQRVGGNKDVQTHTVAGWFRVTKKSDAETLLWAAFSFAATTESAKHAGYKVTVTSGGLLKVVKTSIPLADVGNAVLSSSAVPNGEWFYLSLAVTEDTPSRSATVKAFVNGNAFAMGTGTFATNLDGETSCVSFQMGDGISCAGLRIDDTAVEDADTIKGWATSSTYLVAASTDIAEWTGKAGDGDVTNARNWRYTGMAAEPTEKVPASTSVVVTFGGTLWFNATAAKTFKCKSIKLTDNVTLSQDCDWSGLPYAPTFGGFTIDIKGHALTLAKLPTAAGTVTDSTEDAKNPGRLIITVASSTLNNSYLTISGNLRLVKEGAGTFIGKVKNQSYTGGTVVNAGTLKSSDAENYFYYGATNTPVTVNAGGTLDIAGKYRWYVHDLTLNGGTLANSGANQTSYTSMGLGNVTMTADSKALLKYSTLFNGGVAALDLGGHTLTVERATGTTANIFFSFNGEYAVRGGTIVCGTGIKFYTYGPDVDVSDLALHMNGSYSWTKKYATEIRELVANSTKSEDDKLVTVTGRFASGGNYDNICLADGATLDLNDNEGVFSTASGFSGRTLTFADEAKITVDISKRAFAGGDLVVSWSAKPSATFQWDAATRAKGVTAIAGSDGLYYGGDPGSKDVAEARWTNATGDGNVSNTANWKCYNLSGVEVKDALPNKDSVVYLVGDTPIRVTSPVTWGGICLTGMLTADFDLSGVTSVKFSAGAAFDLNGHTVKIGPLSESSSSVKIADYKVESKTPGALVLATETSKLFGGFETDLGVRVRVEGGATLDLNGIGGTLFKVVLADGATLTNTKSDIAATAASIGGGMALDAGATAYVVAAKKISLVAPDFDLWTLELNGGTLVKRGATTGTETLEMENGYLQGPGTVRIEYSQFVFGSNGFGMSDDAVIYIAKADKTQAYPDTDVTVSNLAGDGTVGRNTVNYTVTKSFSGLLTADGKTVKFASGMTLDLSKNTGTYAVPAKVKMVDNATIKLNLAGRTDLADGMQIVSWTTTTRPSETVRFSVAGAPYIVGRRDNGLYLAPADGLVIGVR